METKKILDVVQKDEVVAHPGEDTGNPPLYLPHQLSWGGCHGGAGVNGTKLKEEIQFA